jgi:LPPG:FO 2-phospho-L-lactate transferase
LGVAEIYAGLVDGMVIDRVDEALVPRIEVLGMSVEIADTVMKSEDDRRGLAETALRFCAAIAKEKGQG